MKRMIKVGALLTVMALLMTSCNCYKKMAKNLDNITASANPELLTLKGSNVTTDITVNFAEKYFEKKAVLKITPVLVYAGGEIVGTPKFVQGESVKDNYAVISKANGGSYSQAVSFPYNTNAKKATLELRVEANCNNTGIFSDLMVIPVAQGVSAVQSLANWTNDMSIMPDNFKRVTTVTESANIMYDVNSSVVKPSSLSAGQVKLLEDFVKENSTKDRTTLGSIHAKGYASPEGPVDLNTKLSQARSNTGKEAINKQLSSVNAKYDAAAYGEDWDGFKKLVEGSNIKDKNLILQVLQMYSSPVQRDQEIKNMSQVFEVLKSDILPQLRRTQVVASADISGKTDAEIKAASKNDINSLTLEEMLYAATLTNDSKEITAIYKNAASKFHDVRTHNNYAVALAKNGDFAEAKKELNKAAAIKSSTEISNNLGVIAIAEGDIASAQKHLSSLSGKDAQANKALLSLANGDYAAATKGLSGYNLAVAEVCNGNLAKAKTALGTNKNANADYLRAVIAVREGDTKGAVANLKTAFEKSPSMKAYALEDVEFAKIADLL